VILPDLAKMTPFTREAIMSPVIKAGAVRAVAQDEGDRQLA
jgi:hypothetical protein